MTRFALIIILLSLTGVSLSAQSTTSAQNCIAIMGDSLPEGTFVAQIPGVAVTVLQSRQIASILDDALQARDLIHYGIYDLSLAASAIIDPDAEAYLTSREYLFGRELNCRFTVVFPFLNDLYHADNFNTGITDYQAGLNDLLEGIRSNSPDSRIILMNFYHTTLVGVGNETYGADVSVAHVTGMNAVHNSFCDSDAVIYCLPLDELFVPIEDYVVRRITADNYQTFSYRPVNPDDAVTIDSHWVNNASAVIFGDGLHLNPDGQVGIVVTLMSYFYQIDPINFAPILQ